jgi:hypothetical protein
MRNMIEIALGVLILSQAYFMMPVHTPSALDWIIFVILLVVGIGIIYKSVQAK